MRRPCWVLGLWVLGGVALAAPADDLRQIQRDLRASMRGGLTEDAAIGLIDRCHDIAEEDESQEFDALALVVTIAQSSGDEDVQGYWSETIERLIEDYVDSPKLVQLVTILSRQSPDRESKAREYLDWIQQETSSKEVKAFCAYTEVDTRISTGSRSGGLSPEARAECIAALEKIRKEYGDIAHPRRVTYAEMTEGPLFELNNLYIGAMAPDIVADDTDGVEFKLSDYRGKVILLDFWGHW